MRTYSKENVRTIVKKQELLKVSIIMAVYNENERILRESIDSIINQSFRNYELIIVLDNPLNTVALKTIVKYKDKRIKLIRNERNIGLALSLNKALEICKGEYIARMDADDIAIIDRINEQVEYLNLHTDVSLVGTNAVYIDDESNIIKTPPSIIEFHNQIARILPYKNIFFHSTWMFRRKILNQINGYRNFSASQDYDFLLRMLSHDYKFANIDRILLKYRIRANSIGKMKSALQIYLSLKIQTYYKMRSRVDYDSFHQQNDILDSNYSNFCKAYEYYNSSKKSKQENKLFLSIIELIRSMIISKYIWKYLYNKIKSRCISRFK